MTVKDIKQAWGRSLQDLWLDGEEGRLHPAERKLLSSAATGSWCVLSDTRPGFASDENRIRASVLRFIALGGDGASPLHEKGVRLKGGFIECPDGSLDFEGCVIPENIQLHHCKIEADLVFLDTLAESVSFSGSQLNNMWADRCETTGTLFLKNGFTATGIVSLMGAKIGGNFSCDDSLFANSKNALRCDGIQVDGNVNLRNGFRAEGPVSLLSAKINGSLLCTAGEFNGVEEAIRADRMQVKGSVFMRHGFRARGSVRMRTSKIGGSLTCRDGRFLCKKTALDVARTFIDGSVFLDREFIALGMIDLSDTTIGSNLDCSHGTFSDNNKSLFAPRALINGNVDLGTECRMAGQVSFQGASIRGDMTFRGGSFEGRPAVNLRNAGIDGMLVWRDVKYVRGELNLAGASCLTLNMDKIAWEKPSEIRLDAFTYKGFSELPKGCDVQFWIDFINRQPNRHLEDRFRPNPYSQLANVLHAMGHEQEAISMRVEQSRRQGVFTRRYEPVASGWLARTMRWLTVIWNYLQGGLVDYGYRPGRAVLFLIMIICLGSGIYQYAALKGVMTPTHPLIYKELGHSIAKACSKNWVYPDPEIAKECARNVPSEYSTFSAITYSLDVAVPIVNFRMEDDWAPRVVDWQTGEPASMMYVLPGNLGGWVRLWEWVQIGLGWLLSLLFVSAVGGIIRR